MGKPSEAWLVLERTAKSQMQKDCLCWYFKGSLFFDQPAISSSLRDNPAFGKHSQKGEVSSGACFKGPHCEELASSQNSRSFKTDVHWVITSNL